MQEETNLADVTKVPERLTYSHIENSELARIVGNLGRQDIDYKTVLRAAQERILFLDSRVKVLDALLS